MTIQHHSYMDGKVQSLGFTDEKGLDMTVGVIDKAGEYNFGIAEKSEWVVVVSGEIIVGNRRYHGDLPLIFEKGSEIRFRTEVPTSYLCIYK